MDFFVRIKASFSTIFRQLL